MTRCPNLCSCHVALHWIPVRGSVGGNILQFASRWIAPNPERRDVYHCALKISTREADESPVYIVELTHYARGRKQARTGQVKSGFAGPRFLHAITGPVYGVRKWRNGQMVDEHKTVPHPIVITRNCAHVRELLNLVESVPTRPYGSLEFGELWTCNSAISWLLCRALGRPPEISVPPNGIAPGWQAGIAAATRGLEWDSKSDQPGAMQSSPLLPPWAAGQ